MVQYRPDILVSDRFGAPVAIIEVKVLNHTNVQTAVRYLRNVLAHGEVQLARFVMLATPDTGYLWSSPGALLQEAAPIVTFPMDRIMQHYLDDREAMAPVSEYVLESIVRQWLADLADGIAADAQATDRLRDAGFLQAIRDGRVTAHSST